MEGQLGDNSVTEDQLGQCSISLKVDVDRRSADGYDLLRIMERRELKVELQEALSTVCMFSLT